MVVFRGGEGKGGMHGATVTATSTSGLTATTNLGGNAITWNVNASSTTRFGKLGEGLSALAKIAIGDIVSFWGKLTGSGSTLTVDAQVIKDHTKQGTTTPKIGKDRFKWDKERFSVRGAFKNFLDKHEGLKARFEARVRADREDA